MYENPAAGDFHLQVGSLAIDAGHPDPEYDDSDSTRNDMGAYGGNYTLPGFTCPPAPIPVLGGIGQAVLAAMLGLIIFIRMRWKKP